MTSSLLSKLDSFLPKMAVANETLTQSIATNPGRNVEVDYISDEEKPYIEMEIAMVPDAETMANLPEDLYGRSRPSVVVDTHKDSSDNGSSGSPPSSSASAGAASSTSSTSTSLASLPASETLSSDAVEESQLSKGIGQ